jgi:hypothetical protein
MQNTHNYRLHKKRKLENNYRHSSVSNFQWKYRGVLFTEKEQEKANYSVKNSIEATILIQFHIVFTKM